jgi:Domain of unknown function (DUF4192)
MTQLPSTDTHDPQAAPASPPPRPDARTPEWRVRIGSPTAILAIIPPLLSFEPGRSFVVIGVEQPRGRVCVTLRFDLPDPGNPGLAAEIAETAVAVLSAQHISTAVAVGYGSDEAVAPVVSALRERAPQAQIALTELLRAQDHRYWSYVCTEPACCPADGTAFDLTGHPAARAMTGTGRQILASRDELRATLAAADGDPAKAMRRAVGRVEGQIAACVARMTGGSHRIVRRRVIATVGRLAVTEAIDRYRAGETVDIELAAWLSIALREVRVRDDAWARMLPEHQDAHRRLWTDLTRLARPGYVAAPASLLAFVAWQSGDGALGNIALDRALADNPRYSMARLLREALDLGAPPSLARLPMTPEEVAACFDAADAADSGDKNPDEAVPAGEARCM